MSVQLSKKQIITFSKRLSYILRHATNIKRSKDGYVLISIIEEYGINKETLYYIVENDGKDRFEIKDEIYVRAVQGHSAKEVSLGASCESIEGIPPNTYLVHGTTSCALKEIQSSGGISRMGRNGIHCAIMEYIDGKYYNTRKSGIRTNAEELLVIDVEKLLKLPDVKMYEALNGVILIDIEKVPCDCFEAVHI